MADLLNSFVALFVIIDPIGLAPIFILLTRGMDPALRRRIALRGTAVAFLVLALFGLAGETLLALIGIGMPAFRVAGGILLFVIALEMLFEKRGPRRERQAEAHEDPSVFPLAVPLLAGPGALTTMILLMERERGDPLGQALLVAAMAAALAVALLLFLLAGPVERLLGPTVITVITRLLGMLLAALAVQFVLDGLAASGLAGPAPPG